MSATVIKIVTKAHTHRNLVSRKRNFVGTSNTKYEYEDQVNLGPAQVYSFTDSRETHQPSDWNYRSLIARHQNATTFLKGERFVIEPSDNYWSARWTAYDPYKAKDTDQFDQGWGCVPNYRVAPPIPTTSINPDAELEAKYRLYKTLKDKRNAWEGMIFLGELRELIHMVRHPAESLRRGLSDWVKSTKKYSRYRSLPAINRALAGSWLEWNYGIAPTISDLESAQEALKRHTERYEELYQKFAAWSEPQRLDPLADVSYQTSYYPWTFNCVYRRYSTSVVGYYGQVFTAASTARGFSRQQLGFELRNFIPTLYELCPWSFLIDYFSNLGDIVNAASTYTGDVAWVASTYVNEGVVEHWCRSVVLGTLNTSPSTVKRLQVVTSFPSPFVVRRRYVQRTPLSGVPVVNPVKDFRLEIPGVGSTKWANILALVTMGRSAERLLRSGR